LIFSHGSAPHALTGTLARILALAVEWVGEVGLARLNCSHVITIGS
jgi:hypothetical protein